MYTSKCSLNKPRFKSFPIYIYTLQVTSWLEHWKCRMLRGQTQSLSAQKHNISIIFWHGQKSLFHFSHRNYGIRCFLMFCARDKNVVIYWRTMGEMTFALFSNFTSRAVFWKSRLEVVHRLSFLGATSMLSERSQVQVSYGYNRRLECFYVAT